MTDETKTPLPAYYAPPSAPRAPAHGSVDLPAGNAWFGRTATVLRKNAAQVRAHSDFLEARREQANSARSYIDAKVELARSLARLSWLPEILEADFRQGLEDRRHALAMQHIAHQTAETQANIGLAAVQQQLAQYFPAEKKSAPTPPASAGLSAEEVVAAVDEITDHMPDLPPEVRKHLTVLLSAYLKERRK